MSDEQPFRVQQADIHERLIWVAKRRWRRKRRAPALVGSLPASDGADLAAT
jgi:hypothetical protein